MDDFSRRFDTVLIELSNDILANPKKYSQYTDTLNNHYRYLRILAGNMSRGRRIHFIKKYRDYLLSLDVDTRIEIMIVLAEFLITMAFGRDERYFEDMDKKNGKDKRQKDEAHYPYISAPSDAFLRTLGKIYDSYGEREAFVDVGCGIGDKVYLAWLSGIFKECVGIEYEGFTSSIGREITERLVYPPNITLERAHIYSTKWHSKKREKALIELAVIKANAFDVGYWRFDTIYSYHPIVDKETMSKLYTWIFKTMGAKSILVEMMQCNGLEKAIINYNDEDFKLGYRLGHKHYYKTTTDKIRSREF